MFRDRTGLAGALLWPSIEAALKVSRWLIVFASPQAVASPWCVKEQQWWLDTHGTERLLFVLTDGEIVWDRARNDFDLARSSAIAPIFAGRFAAEPLWIDLRWARGVQGLGLRHPRFRECLVDAAAPIRGQRKDEIDSADLRQLARNRALVRGGVAAIAVAGTVAAWQAVVASRERDAAVQARAEAEAQRDAALARALAIESVNVREGDDGSLALATLLALHSMRIEPNAAARQALRDALALLPRHAWQTAADPRGELARVRALALHDAAGLVAAGRDDGRVQIVRAADGSEVRSLPHGSGVAAVAFSTDGTHLATAADNGTARWWRVAGSDAPLEMEHDAVAVVSLAPHPQRPLLATGTRDGHLRLWNLADGRELKRLPLGGEVRALAWNPRGDRLAAIATDGTVAVVDADGTEHWRRGGGYAGLALAWNADGTRLAVSRGDHAAVLDAATGSPLMRATHADALVTDSDNHLRWITSVAWSPDSRVLVTAAREGTLRWWNVADGREVLRRGPASDSVVFDPLGRFVAAVDFAGRARVWDATTGREWLRDDRPGGSAVLAFSADGTRLVSGGLEGQLATWPLARADASFSALLADVAEALAGRTDGTRIASADRSGALVVRSAGGEAVATRADEHGTQRLAFSHDGATLVALKRLETVTFFDAATLEVRARLRLRGGTWAIGPRHVLGWDRNAQQLQSFVAASAAPAASQAASGVAALGMDPRGDHAWSLRPGGRGERARLVVHALPSLAPLAEWPADADSRVALAPGGQRVASTAIERDGISPRQVVLLREGTTSLQLVPDAPLVGLQFDASGTLLVGWGDHVQTWDARTGQPLARWRDEALRLLRLAPRGDALALGLRRAVRIVDPRSGADLAVLPVEGSVSDFAWGGDGATAITADHERGLIARRWRDADLQARACEQLAGLELTPEQWSRHLGGATVQVACAKR